VKTLKPYIDKNYRTRKGYRNTALIGSSLGGLISYYGGLKYPKVFGNIGAMSPSFWFSGEVVDFTKSYGKQKKLNLYVLVGGLEGPGMVDGVETTSKLLLESGFNPKRLKTKIVPEGKHNEAFWQGEFLPLVQWLYQ
jgi:alpha-glucosidase